jgi:putative oxidoreductase
MERCDGRWQGIGIAALRLIVGVVFLVHGSQKLFVYGFHGVAQFLAGAGFPLAGVAAVVLTLVEFLGGIALILGALTRGAAALLAINMAVAVLAVHAKNGFFLPAGYEYALTLLVANLSLVLAGGGVCALDNLFCRARAPQPEVRSDAV